MKINRRQFLAVTALTSVAGYFYYKGEKISIYESEIQTLLAVAYHLYPSSDLGFGAKDLNLASYMTFVLQDERILQDDRDYLLRGTRWMQEHSLELTKKSFITLKSEQKEGVIKDAVEYQWGYSYINYLFSYIFEAMFSAPVYGSNINEMGWKFVGHQAGFPQPQSKKDIHYV
jgi:gluconate 2-dehydrogenase gamma chain